MTQHPLHHAPPPSWTRPIALGALFAMFAEVAPIVLSTLLPDAGIAMPCCCAIEILPMGLLPAWLAKRQDPTLTPGQGFAVSFIAVGLSSVLVALMMSLQIKSIDTASLRRHLLDTPTVQSLSAEEKQQMVDSLIALMPYVPPIGACVITLLSGLFGIAGVALGSARAPSLGVPPPGPPPAASPPPAPPQAGGGQ